MEIPKQGDFVRRQGLLIRTEEYTPPRPPTEIDFIFEEQEARTELRLNTLTVSEIQTLNDYYGPGTAVESSIKEAKEYAEENGINKDSDLEIIVIKIVNQFRAKIINKAPYNDYLRIESYQRSGVSLPDPVETIVWSTKDE